MLEYSNYVKFVCFPGFPFLLGLFVTMDSSFVSRNKNYICKIAIMDTNKNKISIEVSAHCIIM